MDKTEIYLNSLFTSNHLAVTDKRKSLFEAFVNDERNKELVKTILENQKTMVTDWKLKNRIEDIKQQVFMIPNGTVGKAYTATIDFEKNNWTDFSHYQLENLENVGGIEFNKETNTISGNPEQSGEFKILLKYRLNEEPEDSELHEKIIPFIINPDPKSLWKDIASNTEDEFWKADNTTAFGKIADKHIVVASKRGRSHANVGSFRDDDFSFCNLEESGWSLVVVSDGAGSAKISRHGSQLACEYITDYFKTTLSKDQVSALESLIISNQTAPTDAIKKELSLCIYNLIGSGAKKVHDQLADFAAAREYTLNDLNSTFIFSLFKPFEFGTAVLTFGVGDCPVAIIPKDFSEVKLMNWLDVGEFGGGTRFITTSEIFTSPKFASRINFKVIPDYAYMFLMTDGIYDPKFVVEANLEKVEKWKEFVDDLNGNNDAGIKVELDPTNKDIEKQLSDWMDFWSPGNHDDRTLAIVF
ncbi:MAG: PP2C family serine/threonine-protein phosphatase [Bacteroidota bacterium]